MPQNNDLQPLLDVQQNQLGFLLATSDTLDTKNLSLLALNVAVLIFAAQSLDGRHSLPIISFFMVYLISVGLNLVATWPKNYSGTAVDMSEHPDYLSMATPQLVLQLLADTQAAITHNSHMNNLKLRLCVVSLGLSTAGALLLVWCILFV
jgi:hypothetical protein